MKNENMEPAFAENENIELHEDFLDPELSENQEKLEALTDKKKKIVDDISDWLIKVSGCEDYDIDEEFKVGKIIPLLKHVEHGTVIFNESDIVQNLRLPIELINKAGDVIKKISSLKYKARYRAHELNNYTKGVNMLKEMNLYMDAQIGMLTGTARSIIGKLWNRDHEIARLIQSLYFL